jgi:hypothetical protein
VCTTTVTAPDVELIGRVRAEDRLWTIGTIDSSHDLMITAPQAVTDALLEITER